MKDRPDIEKIQQVVPEAINLEEIGSGGFKVVYKALVAGCIESGRSCRVRSCRVGPR